jgi:membrane dipeptidase
VLADLHAHYPMHVLGDVTPDTALERMRKVRGRPGLGNKARALVLWAASTLASNRDLFSGPRISVRGMRDGGVGLAMSVLYGAFEEMDLGKPYAAPPDPVYFDRLKEDLQRVEDEVGGHDPALIRLVRDRAELERCLEDRATALVHCVEGGFHLGNGEAEIEANVAELARRGVAYVTVAHLFFRQVATNTPALPFLKDPVYNRVFPQPDGEGLTERGVALIRAMVRHRVLIDVSHMREDAIAETFRLLDDELDPECAVPVISTHAGYRFGKQRYMHDDKTVLQIKRRDGVIGLIMAQHQLNDGLRRRRTKDFEASFEVIRAHIDKIAELTGSHRHVALGTDFDGFIKPTMGGLESMADARRLEGALRQEYRDADAELIASGNALRVLRQTWPADQTGALR